MQNTQLNNKQSGRYYYLLLINITVLIKCGKIK